MTTITIDRATVEQALEALEYNGLLKKRQAITTLRAALVQQAEPLNLSDPAVQKRLATQWGYVPAAAQAEPVEPVAWYRPSIAPDYYAPVFVEGAQPPAPLTQAEARLLGWRPLVPPKAEPVGRCEDCGMKYCECGERR